jgi:DNA-directed RNA polymerase specialized sigma24 family protein
MVISHDQQRELLGGLPSDLLRAAFLLRSMDYSMPEIAELLGVGLKKIENAVYRYHSKQPHQPAEGRGPEEGGGKS